MSERPNYNFDWSELAFGSKAAVRNLNAIFIAAQRELSAARFKQLVQQFLPQGNIVLGLAKEPYIDGFAGQPQFRTLRLETVRPIIDKVNTADTPHKIHILKYSQNELSYILEKINFKAVYFVNGSWQHSLHTKPFFYTMASKGTVFNLISPFVDEKEAREYEEAVWPQITESLSDAYQALTAKKTLDERRMLSLASDFAKQSFDHTFQTGTVLGRQSRSGPYVPLIGSFNKIVPFQTYALLNGASREQHFSPPNDLNHYDTVHAEVELLIAAQKQKLDLTGTTLFINLMPCPTCARMLADTDIAEIVYQLDHSDGYAVALLEKAGKTVRRVV